MGQFTNFIGNLFAESQSTGVRIQRVAQPEGNYPLNRVIAYVSVNGSALMPFIVDTGSPETCIIRSAAPTWTVGTPRSASFPLVQAPVNALFTTGNSLTLVGFILSNVAIPVADVPALTQEGVCGLIGDKMLSRFRVTIAYGNLVLSLEI